MILLLATILLASPPKRPPPEVACPPYWKCNGPPETRAANCECWERY